MLKKSYCKFRVRVTVRCLSCVEGDLAVLRVALFLSCVQGDSLDVC